MVRGGDVVTHDLLSWRAAPTTSGPRTASSDGHPPKATSSERWAAFVEAHKDVADKILARARNCYGRVSTKQLTEWARATFRVEINNSATAGMADWLIAQAPELLERIERRRRKAS